MATITAGQRQDFFLSATEGLFVSCTGAANVSYADEVLAAPGLVDLSSGEVRIGYFGVPMRVTISVVSGTCTVNTSPSVFQPLEAVQDGDNNDSSPLDLKLSINGLQNGALGFDAITLKGMPQAAGAPAGYGDLASAVISGADTIKSLSGVIPSDGQIYSFTNFCDGAKFSCTYKYDAAADKSLNDGFGLIAPEAISAWDGTLSNLSALVGWTGVGFGAFVLVSFERNDNASGTSLLIFRDALSKMRLDSGSKARILLVGDSTTAGSGASGVSGYPSGARPFGPPFQIKKALEDAGYSANAQAVVQNQAISPDFFAWDGRFNNLGGWIFQTLNSSYSSVFRNTTTTNPLRFTPSEPFNTIKVWYAVGSGSSSFLIKADNDAVGLTVTMGPTGGAMLSATYTAPSSAAYVDISRVTGSIYILAIEAYVATNQEVILLQMGRSGGRVSNLKPDSNQWDALNCAKNLNPDLVIINLAINEWINAGSTGDYYRDFVYIIDSFVAAGIDVSLTTGVPTDVATTSQSQQQRYVNIVRLVSMIKNVPLIDTYKSFGSRTIANSFYTDYTHPNKYGYLDCAELLSSVVLSRP